MFLESFGGIFLRQDNIYHIDFKPHQVISLTNEYVVCLKRTGLTTCSLAKGTVAIPNHLHAYSIATLIYIQSVFLHIYAYDKQFFSKRNSPVDLEDVTAL